MAFEATPPSGNRFYMDASADSGGENKGPTPVEALVASVAACSAMDIISVLTKKRQNVTAYRVEVEWERATEGEWPRPITALVLRHILSGDVDEAAANHAVQLSDEKYCTVIATLRYAPTVRSEIQLV